MATHGGKNKTSVMVRMHSVSHERRRLSQSAKSHRKTEAPSSSSSSSHSSSERTTSESAASDVDDAGSASDTDDHYELTTTKEDPDDPLIAQERAATLREHIPKWTQHLVEEPSVLSLADAHVTISGKHRGPTDSAVNHYPMHFAQAIQVAGNPNVKESAWIWRQGGDPMVHPHVRSMLDKELQPLIVIRLNPFEPQAGESTRLEDYYGPHCRRVFYVYDMAPSMIKEYDRTMDDSVRTIHALAVILGDLYEGVLQEMEKLVRSGDLPGDVPPAVYLHCHMGLERSRFMFIALHGLFYANSALVKKNYNNRVLIALDYWAARQALFVRERLTVGSLLTRDQPAMYLSLVHAMAALLGVDQAQAAKCIRRYEKRSGSTFERNILNVCAAGANCKGQVGRVSYMCMGCHAAFFCSLDCVVASNHLALAPNTGYMCSKHYPQRVYPQSLYTRREKDKHKK